VFCGIKEKMVALFAVVPHLSHVVYLDSARESRRSRRA
jgi:hypothetical protein